MELKKISQKEFDRMKLSLNNLTYEKLLQLWGISDFEDSEIGEKCGVPSEKIKRLRSEYDISIQSILYHVQQIKDRELRVNEEADAILDYIFNGTEIMEKITSQTLSGIQERMQKLIILKQSADPKRYWRTLKQ